MRLGATHHQEVGLAVAVIVAPNGVPETDRRDSRLDRRELAVAIVVTDVGDVGVDGPEGEIRVEGHAGYAGNDRVEFAVPVIVRPLDRTEVDVREIRGDLLEGIADAKRCSHYRQLLLKSEQMLAVGSLQAGGQNRGDNVAHDQRRVGLHEDLTRGGIVANGWVQSALKFAEHDDVSRRRSCGIQIGAERCGNRGGRAHRAGR